MKKQKLHTPKPFDFRTLKRATILITEPGFGQIIEQEYKGVVSPRLREAVQAARKAYAAVMKTYDGL